jgi:hypothetical protein
LSLRCRRLVLLHHKRLIIRGRAADERSKIKRQQQGTRSVRIDKVFPAMPNELWSDLRRKAESGYSSPLHFPSNIPIQ